MYVVTNRLTLALYCVRKKCLKFSRIFVNVNIQSEYVYGEYICMLVQIMVIYFADDYIEGNETFFVYVLHTDVCMYDTI